MNHFTTPLERVKINQYAAESYLKRNKRKHQREMSMIEAAFNQLEGVKTVLDAPCGVGRASIFLAKQGYQVHAVDLGDAAVSMAQSQACEAGQKIKIEKQDIFHLPFLPKQFDAVLCFRLIHHFQEKQLRNSLVAELCNVSGRYVILSYISHHSVTTLKRLFKYWQKGTPIKQYPSTQYEMDASFKANGFRHYKNIHYSPLIHSLQLVIYERIDS